MTFSKFEELFKQKYPEGFAVAHGKMGGTEKSMKITVGFNKNSKSYSYYGAYEDVLCKVGINVISKQRFGELEARLKQYKEWHGTEDFFGGIMDCSKDIEAIEKQIAIYKAEWIIA